MYNAWDSTIKGWAWCTTAGWSMMVVSKQAATLSLSLGLADMHGLELGSVLVVMFRA